MSDWVLGPSRSEWERLRQPLEVSPATFEILRHKLEAINEEQAIALKAVSASPIVTEASDFNNGLYAPSGEIVSMGPQVVYHSGSMPLVIQHVIADCQDDPGIDEGDMFIVNDPFKGVVHHPDVALVAPIHYQGELVGWSGVAAHQVDVGGLNIGSISVSAHEKHQEGLMMPPLKLIEGGRLRSDLWRLIMNMTRQPAMVGLDLKGFIASNMVARQRLVELIDSYGLDVVKTVMSELTRYSERRFRERIQTLPDGEFRSRGYLDHDGHHNELYRVDVRLIKRGDTLTFDLSGSSSQAPGFINCTASTLVGAVFGGTAPLLAREIPWNQGVLRAIEIVAPPGIICNATPPAPTGSATIATGWVVVSTVVHALSKLLSLSGAESRYAQAVTNGAFDALVIGDRNQHGEGYGTQLMDAQIGGGGASAIADGIDQSGGFVTPRPNIPNVESSEMHGPMLYLYRSFFADTGGTGARRGGRAAGLAFTPHGVERIRCTLATQGVEVPVSPGLFGGWPGTCNRHAVIRSSSVREALGAGAEVLALDGRVDRDTVGGDVDELPAKVPEFRLSSGDVLEYSWAGGGGYGDPLDRPVEAVVADVAQGVVTAEEALIAYGVVLDGAGTADMSVTQAQRDAQRRSRLAEFAPPKRVWKTPPDDPLVTADVGPSMRLVQADGRRHFSCRCGHVFCPADSNWKLAATARLRADEESPPGLRLHAKLRLAEYACPGCGVLHAVDLQEAGDEPLQDFLLTVDGC